MTGRRLYDRFCDALAAGESGWRAANHQLPKEPIAWPFLCHNERRIWNDFARRVTPRKRKP